MVKLWSDNRGNMLIETAVLFPVILIIVFGLIDSAAIVSAKRTIDAASFVTGEAVRYNRNFNPSIDGATIWKNVFEPSLNGIEYSNATVQIAKVSYANDKINLDWSISNRKDAPKFDIDEFSKVRLSDGVSVFVVDTTYKIDSLGSEWLIGDVVLSSRKVHSSL